MANAVGNVFIGLGPASTFSVATNEVGYMDGGVTVRVERDYFDFLVDQEKTIIGKEITLKRAFVVANVAEASLANLVHAWDNGALTGSTLTVDETVQGEVALSFVGNGPDGSARTVAVAKAVSTGNGEQSYVKDDKVIIPIEFEAIGDPAESGKLLTMVDA